MCEHLGRCSVPSAYNTSAGSAEPLITGNEEMRRALGVKEIGSQDLGPESGNGNTNEAEPGNWDDAQTAGLPGWPGVSDKTARADSYTSTPLVHQGAPCVRNTGVVGESSPCYLLVGPQQPEVVGCAICSYDHDYGG